MKFIDDNDYDCISYIKVYVGIKFNVIVKSCIMGIDVYFFVVYFWI